ncbi:MAG: BatA domain-containing protein [Cyclobacteriaceae bacterium]
MSFVYPSFLWGLLALSIPIIIHLFNFRRTKKVYFSNNLFLKNVKKTTTSKLKVKHLLILMARLLFITFLVLTFAQPFLPGKESDEEGNQADKLVYIYLDNSLSMSSELSSNVRGIDQGVNYIEEILALYPRNTRYKLLTNEFGSFSRVPKSRDEMGEMVAEVDLVGVSRKAEEVMSKIRSDVQASAFGASSDVVPDVYLISDFQKSTSGDLALLTSDTLSNIKVVPIGITYESNIYIDSVYLANPFVLTSEVNELAVSLRNDGSEEVNDQVVRLLINDEQVSSASLDIGANSSGEIRFTLNFPLQQNNRCQLVFEDYPVTFDNEFFFTLNLGDKISVLEIKPGQQNALSQDSSTIARVYANNTVFDFQSFRVDNLDYSLIEGADLLVLNELGNTSEESNRAVMPYIRDFLTAGGHLIFIPPATGDLSFLQQAVSNGAISAERIVLPDSVEQTTTRIANPDLANPFFEGMFEGDENNFDMPEAQQLIRHNLQGEALLSYRSGEPYLLRLSRSQIGVNTSSSDQVFVFATPLRSDFTGVYRHAIFVPVMYRLASLSKSENKELYYYVNNPTLSLDTDTFAEGALPAPADASDRRFIYKMVKEEQEIIPAQRVVSGRLLLEVPQDVVGAGFYELIRSEESSDEGQQVEVMSLSFNIDENESEMEQYGVDELQAFFDNADNIGIYEADDVESFADMIRSEQTNIALWKYSLLLALFFLLTEILLIRFL